MTMKNEHESQIRALKLQHEDEYRKLQQELDLQKSKVRVIALASVDRFILFILLTGI